MGITQVLGKLPLLVRRIRQTAAAIIAAKPDVLVIVDSPDFTHRVARRVRMALPDLPVVNYVCPSVWAWKE
jgi:lipid-A-disaccharide synthase